MVLSHLDIPKEQYEQLPSKLGRPFYSFLGTNNNTTLGLTYREVEKIKNVSKLIRRFQQDYEKQEAKIDIPMFDYITEQIIKVNRAIQQPFSNVILIGLQGLGKF